MWSTFWDLRKVPQPEEFEAKLSDSEALRINSLRKKIFKGEILRDGATSMGSTCYIWSFCVWACNAFQRWPALLVPPGLFKTMSLFLGSVLGIILWSVTHRDVHEGWNVCRNRRETRVFLVCFVQRQHLQRSQDWGDGASAEGGSGWETQTSGTQGENVLQMHAVHQKLLKQKEKQSRNPDLLPAACEAEVTEDTQFLV